MIDKKGMIKSFKPLLEHQPLTLLSLFAFTLFLGLSSGLSVVLLIPLLQLLSPNSLEGHDQLSEYFFAFAQKIGLELNIEIILVIYLFLLSSIALMNYRKNILSARYHRSLVDKIRQRLFRKIIMSDWVLLNHNSKTNYLMVLSQEIPKLSNYFFFFLKFFISVIIIGSYIAWALVISVQFTLIVVVLGLTMFFSLRQFLTKAFNLGQDNLNAYRQLLKYIDDFWTTIKIAKVHSSEHFYYNKFNNASSSLLETEFKIHKNHYLPQLIYKLAGLLVLVLVVYFGYRFELMPLTTFFILIILFSRIYPQFNSINTDLNMISSHFASVKLVMQLDADYPDPDMTPQASQKPLALKEVIQVNALNFAYKEEQFLFKDLNITIPAMSIVGIIGKSGKGKTTLLDIIAGLQPPISGEILIDGHPLDRRSLHRWRKGIGYLPQDSFFVDGTIRENIIWDSKRTIDNQSLLDLLEEVNARHLIERYDNGLDEYITNYPFHFSGGERQRLALARVLLRQPQVLLLDEVTSSLDQTNEKQIMTLLEKLKSKITIILVTHNDSIIPWLDHTIDLDAFTTKNY